jgi:hypothetical protein
MLDSYQDLFFLYFFGAFQRSTPNSNQPVKRAFAKACWFGALGCYLGGPISTSGSILDCPLLCFK